MYLTFSTAVEGSRCCYQYFINEDGEAQGSELTLQGPQL